MTQNVQQMVKALRAMTVTELRRKYQEVFGERCRSGNKQHLQRRIAWRMQALAEGDLPARAARLRDKAKDLAGDADLRLNAPRHAIPFATPAVAGPLRQIHIAKPPDLRFPLPGTLISRQYKGRNITVQVLPGGFDYEGLVYR